MNTKVFTTPAELAEWVTAQSIPQANIVTILQRGNVLWLFWYTP